MPDNILEILLETVINYGILKAIVVFAFAFIGYKLGDSSFTGGIKKIILKRLKED